MFALNLFDFEVPCYTVVLVEFGQACRSLYFLLVILCFLSLLYISLYVVSSLRSLHFIMQESSRGLSMARIRCILRGLDLKTYIFLFALIPTCVFGIYVHGQKISYFLRPLWESPPKAFHEIPHYYHENVSMERLWAF